MQNDYLMRSLMFVPAHNHIENDVLSFKCRVLMKKRMAFTSENQ
jgi:hypothetical protein